MKVTDKLNKVHCMNWLDNSLPDKCAKLIIADPPYYKVKGDFDFIWKTFADYLKDVEKWAVECKRVLADNGTILWYGDAKNIAYAQIIFDKYFNLLSNITCHIYDRQTNKITTEDARTFISTTERVLMYGNKLDDKMFDDFYHDTVRKSIEPTHKYLNLLITRNELAEKLLNVGNCKNIASAKQNANNILKQTSAKPQFITEFQYNLIDADKKTYEELRKEYEELRKEYEELRKEYEELRRPFNPTEKYKMDVLRVSQEGHITGNYDHDTVKPEKLTRILITTCSRENDLVIVPFAGSGTECSMSAKEGREFIGYDIEQKYVDMANKRVETHISQTRMF